MIDHARSKGKAKSQAEMISMIVEDYALWYTRLVRCMLYPDQCDELDTAFAQPHKGLEALEDVPDIAVLREAQDSLAVVITKILPAIRQKGIVSRKLYDEFSHLYDSFFMRLRRVERDHLSGESGVDSLSGLRSLDLLTQDLERERERLARDGNPFCLVLARIDDFARHSANDSLVSDIAKLVQKALRTFDDAYYLGRGEFLLSVKQTDIKGGRAAVNRMKDFVARADLTDNTGDEISLSYCVAEPLPEDKPDIMIDNMRADLKDYGAEAATAIEYVEQSPLARYMRKEQGSLSNEND